MQLVTERLHIANCVAELQTKLQDGIVQITLPEKTLRRWIDPARICQANYDKRSASSLRFFFAFQSLLINNAYFCATLYHEYVDLIRPSHPISFWRLLSSNANTAEMSVICLRRDADRSPIMSTIVSHTDGRQIEARSDRRYGNQALISSKNLTLSLNSLQIQNALATRTVNEI